MSLEPLEKLKSSGPSYQMSCKEKRWVMFLGVPDFSHNVTQGASNQNPKQGVDLIKKQHGKQVAGSKKFLKKLAVFTANKYLLANNSGHGNKETHQTTTQPKPRCWRIDRNRICDERLNGVVYLPRWAREERRLLGFSVMMSGKAVRRAIHF